MERLALTLIMDLSDRAPAGPGWYIRASSDQQAIIDWVNVSEEDARRIALAYHETMVASSDTVPSISMDQLVTSGNRLIHTALREELQRAEALAARIPQIRKKLAALQPEAKTDGD